MPEDFLDKIDVNSYFSYNILDISQTQHRKVRVSKGSNKKLFAMKLFHYSDIKIQQRYSLQKELNISVRELISLVDSLCDFLKTFDEVSKCIQIALPKPKTKLGSTKSKDSLFAHYCKDVIEHPKRQIRLSFWFQNSKPCVFSNKLIELHGT